AQSLVSSVLDGLIERDRMLADERLRKFRDGADRTLAHQRSTSPPLDRIASKERHEADAEKNVERSVTDILLEQERLRADTIVAIERREHASDCAQLKADGQQTRDQLSTERHGAEVTTAALDEAAKMLARTKSEQARAGEALGMVTHDLRSPLAVIAMNAEIIAEHTTEPVTREAAEEVAQAAGRMGRLLKDLLDVARMDSDAFAVAKAHHGLNVLLNEILRTYGPLFAQSGIDFTVAVPADDIVASFDRDRLLQVLSNLLDNAIKFTPPGGAVRLHIESRGWEVEITLRDSGPGIDVESLPHVFKRFWQRDKDRRRGLGLGLYICQRIVAAHGGRIWAESGPDGGTTFRFTLPID
ncbi:MAG: HAMP domain-containing histidine kinase, partial [Myxococcota bacterium]|nr:HAMP domain-containing histidine kinase [Myxococcota bacterium]